MRLTFLGSQLLLVGITMVVSAGVFIAVMMMLQEGTPDLHHDQAQLASTQLRSLSTYLSPSKNSHSSDEGIRRNQDDLLVMLLTQKLAHQSKCSFLDAYCNEQVERKAQVLAQEVLKATSPSQALNRILEEP